MLVLLARWSAPHNSGEGGRGRKVTRILEGQVRRPVAPHGEPDQRDILQARQPRARKTHVVNLPQRLIHEAILGPTPATRRSSPI